MNILSIRTSTFGSAHPFVLIAAVAAVSLLSGCAGRTAHAMDSPGATKVRAKVQESAGGGRAAAKLPRVPPPEASAAKVAAGYKVEGKPMPIRNTGVIWRVTRDGQSPENQPPANLSAPGTEQQVPQP